METRIVNATDANGNPVEICTIIHNGHEYTALGAVLDPERPTVYTSSEQYSHQWPAWHKLTTWSGETIGRYHVTNTYRNNFGAMIECIAAVLDMNGRYYYGRKSRDWSQVVNLRPGKS